MSHFYFDVHDGLHVRDECGRDLPDIETAKAEAMRIASGFAANPKMLGEGGGAIVVEVRDETNATVLTAQLVFNITLNLRGRS